MQERADLSIQLRCQIEQFRSDWQHCATSSNFLADSSSEEPYLRNLLSSALNELLELVFKLGSGAEQAALQLTRRAHWVELSLNLPLASCDEAPVLAELESLGRNGPERLYLDQLGGERLSPLFGLLQLMSDFGAQLKWRMEDGVLRLHVGLPVGVSA